jgi:hypothetical protein
MSQICPGFFVFNHSLKRREEKAPLWGKKEIVKYILSRTNNIRKNKK